MKDDEIGRVYAQGEIIFKEGEEADRMYVVQSGKVKITKKTVSGALTIATLESGEIFGEMALFDRLPRSATAQALGDARVLSIDKEKLFSTISKDPTLVFKILESMSRKIRKLNEEFMQLKKDKLDILHLYLDVDAICSFILEEAKRMIRADNGSVMLLDDKYKTLSIKAAFGSESEHKMRLTVGEGVAGDVLKTGKAELINNVSLDSRFKPWGVHITSMLCVPLKGNKYNFGVINITNTSKKYFAIDDLKILHSIAIHASIAIENAKNFSKLKNATDELIMHATMLDMG